MRGKSKGVENGFAYSGGYPTYIPPPDYTTGANAAASSAENITPDTDTLSINEFLGQVRKRL